MKDDTPSFDFEAAPGPPAQLSTQKAQSVRQPGGMGGAKVDASPYHPAFDFDEAPSMAAPSPTLAVKPGEAMTASAQNGVVPSRGDSGRRSSWREVPQALFLSWSPARQSAYCAARDRDSAEHAENEEWRKFYLKRAYAYKADLPLDQSL